MNKVQIAGISLILIGVVITIIYKEEVSDLVTGIFIGLGTGLTVYRKRNQSQQ